MHTVHSMIRHPTIKDSDMLFTLFLNRCNPVFSQKAEFHLPSYAMWISKTIMVIDVGITNLLMKEGHQKTKVILIAYMIEVHGPPESLSKELWV